MCVCAGGGSGDHHHQSMFAHFLNAYTSRKFVAGLNYCHEKLAHSMHFCTCFPKFETKLYTDTLLTQVSHCKTAKSWTKNNRNTFANNKPNHSTRCRSPHSFKKSVWRKHLAVF
jgi:hypothetical protein